MQTEERKRQLRKLKSDLHTLQKRHQVKARHLPTTPRRSHSEIRQRLVSKKLVSNQPEVMKNPEISIQTDGEYEYINVAGMIPEVRNTEDRPPVPPPRKASLCRIDTKSHMTSSRRSSLDITDAKNQIVSPRRLLRMFAERFNARRDKSRSASPVRRPQGSRGLVRRPQVSQLSSTGCASMMSASGFYYNSRSCQLSSAECTKTMSLPVSGLMPELSQNPPTGEEEPDPPSGGDQCIFLGELSSIHHVTQTPRGECFCCPVPGDESLQYPKASTPTVPGLPSGTLRENPLTCASDKKSVKRTLSETFTVVPRPSRSPSITKVQVDSPRKSKPKVQPSMGVSAKQRNLNQVPIGVPIGTRPPCLGAEKTIVIPDSDIVARDNDSPTNVNQTVDSDATLFMQDPLCHKAVTYKLKVSRKSRVKSQLEGLGRQIRELGASKLNLHTLAVL